MQHKSNRQRIWLLRIHKPFHFSLCWASQKHIVNSQPSGVLKKSTFEKRCSLHADQLWLKCYYTSLRTAFLLIDNIVISLKDGGLQSWDSGAELAVGGPAQQRALLCPPAAVLRRAAGCGICDERSAPSFVLSLQHSLFSQSLRLWDDFTIDRADWVHHLYRYPWL